MSKIKPIVKWVGGKNKSISALSAHFPRAADTYYEPFLGGGSVLIHLLTSEFEAREYICSDINQTLISMYRNVQNDCAAVQYHLNKLVDSYNASTQKEEDYYAHRVSFNALTIDEKSTPFGSALFILINRTCFRGLYREGPNGTQQRRGYRC